MSKNSYKCSQCGDKFEYSKGLFEKENSIKCPKCGSQNPKKITASVKSDPCSNPFESRGGG
jgi:putative FmdB family regulatory protein